MSYTDKKHYQINPSSTLIPDFGLGQFVEGYTDERKPFNWQNLLWILFPIVGLVIILIFAIGHFMSKLSKGRVLIFEKGFVVQDLSSSGKVKLEVPYRFDELKGISMPKIRQYQNIYGIRKYNATNFDVNALTTDNAIINVMSGSYRNEGDFPNGYNFEGYASHAIVNHWSDHALKRINRELKEKGCITFYTPSPIVVGNGYVKYEDKTVSNPFKYYFDNGSLHLLPEKEAGSHFAKKHDELVIPVNSMYDSALFLMVISRLLGIK